jgi:hypothetical protein
LEVINERMTDMKGKKLSRNEDFTAVDRTELGRRVSKRRMSSLPIVITGHSVSPGSLPRTVSSHAKG